MLKKIISLCISSLFCIQANFTYASPSEDSSSQSRAPLILHTNESAIKERFIVVFKHPKSLRSDTQSIQSFTNNTVAALSESLSITSDTIFNHSISGFTADLNVQQIEQLRHDPRIDFIEQDKKITIEPIISTESITSDTTWGLDRIDQRYLPLDNNYSPLFDGTGVTAYVIDTGVNIEHIEFGGRATSGFDFIDNDTDTTDCNGHGTHVAGTIGGQRYGVAKNVNIVGVRVLNCSGSGTISSVIAGVDWITANASGPSIANMSLGGGQSLALDKAVENAIQSGISFFLAAGNDNQDACNASPARVTSGVTVGSTNRSDSRSTFSNWGNCVDIFAPGSQITSAWYDGGYRTISGTSMATPHVAGVAAMYLQENRNLTPNNISLLLTKRASINKVFDTRDTANHFLYALSDIECLDNCEPKPQPVPLRELISGLPLKGLSDSQHNKRYFYVDVEAGRPLTVQTIGGEGDADLYVRFGKKPERHEWDCRPYRTQNNETCTINSTQKGRYYIMLNAFSDYRDLSLQANY